MNRVRIWQIVEAVADHFNIPQTWVIGRRPNSVRDRLTWPQRVAVYLANNMTHHTYFEIARRFGIGTNTSFKCWRDVAAARANLDVDRVLSHLETRLLGWPKWGV